MPTSHTVNAADTTLRLEIIEEEGNHLVVVVGSDAGHTREIDRIPADAPRPVLGLGKRTVTLIEAIDVLEHVVDEEAWLAAMADALAEGGELVLRVPLEGPMAWLDALNLYRYIQDTTGVGKDLEETKMKGWHRHYRLTEIERLVRASGLAITARMRTGSPHIDALHLAALGWGVLLRRERNAEERIRAWRESAALATPRARLGPMSSSVVLTARKPAPAP